MIQAVKIIETWFLFKTNASEFALSEILSQLIKKQVDDIS
jgi:hypothetical protein